MKGIASDVKAYWEARGAVCRSGASLADIHGFMERNHVIIPDDLYEYFSMVNGILDFDEHMMAFWPLDKFASLAEVDNDANRIEIEDADRLFVFADFMIESNYYAIRLYGDHAEENVVVSTAAPSPYVVARSFSEFLRMYMDDVNAIM